MKDFVESAYLFRFCDDWNVIKYDEHRFYKNLSGQSLSGVDFAGIYKGEECYLIEVKNYKQERSRNYDKPFEEFLSEMVEKGRDSIRLIKVIKKYLDRKILYRAFYGLIKKYPILNREWFFWSELYRISIEEKKASFVLLIDSDFSIDEILEYLNEKLKDEFGSVKVVSLQNTDDVSKFNIDHYRHI